MTSSFAVAASGNDFIACGQGSLCNLDAHSTTGTSDKPNFTHFSLRSNYYFSKTVTLMQA